MKKSVSFFAGLAITLVVVFFGISTTGRSQAEIPENVDPPVFQPETEDSFTQITFFPQVFRNWWSTAVIRPALKVYDHEINDYLGNQDGIVNPGELIYTGVALENYGTATSYSVVLASIADDPYLNPYSEVYLYNQYLYYAQIDPGEFEIAHDLFLGIAYDTPESYPITVTLIIRDTTEYVYTQSLNLTVTGTDTTPPYVFNAQVSKYYVPQGEPALITAYVYEPGPIASVSANIEAPDEILIADVPLYDDATHGDLVAGDRTFSNFWTPTLQADFYVDIATEDVLGNSGVADNKTFFTSRPFTSSSEILLVLDGNEQFEFSTYYTDFLDANSYTYDVWDTRFRGPSI